VRRGAAVAKAVDLTGGCEWVVEAHGCDEAALRDVSLLASLFESIIGDMGLHLVQEPAWHRFPQPGGITGMALLSESHLACHTFPEYRSICLNLFCCRARPDWDFESALRQSLGAETVQVRRIERRYHT
jgi:S-adenosylmethionine decarboxylase